MISRESVGTGWPEILHAGLPARERHPAPEPEADQAGAPIQDPGAETGQPRPDDADRSTATD